MTMIAVYMGLRTIAKMPLVTSGGLLSVSTLLGVGLFALTGAGWLDPVTGFVIAAFAIHEGKEAWEGELAEDDDD
jgi:divalent metal cation (Fe/Co/Zn/Cd) transporter